MGNNNNNNKQTFQNAKLTEKVAQARAMAITKYMLISVKQISDASVIHMVHVIADPSIILCVRNTLITACTFLGN